VAADLMAETFAAALTAVHAKREPSGADALPWLLTVARNKLVDSARRAVVEQVSRQRLGMQPLILDDPGLARVEELGSSPEALAALARVPDHQRDAVRARVIDERGYADIARQLGCSEMVVRQRVSRGLRALRTTLEADA
jgi:RNA polymerase sigma factor (sigma-70 family)